MESLIYEDTADTHCIGSKSGPNENMGRYSPWESHPSGGDNVFFFFFFSVENFLEIKGECTDETC